VSDPKSRSFTDPVTNISELLGSDFAFVQLFSEGTLPKDCLSTFLHEATPYGQKSQTL
jgi:hypothetical protein